MTKEKRNGSENMEEKVSKEIAKAAEVLEMDIEEVEKKYLDICDINNLSPVDDWKLALSLFRQWFSGVNAYKDMPSPESGGSNSLVKKASGFFLSIDAARDMGKVQNDRIKGEYERNPTEAYNIGRVAVVTQTDDGYSVKRMFKGDEQVKEVSELPVNNHEVDSGRWIVPLDNMPQYGTNPNANFGKPLPHSQFRMAGVFLGEVDEEKGLYFFSYKGTASEEFKPTTFKLVNLLVIKDSNYPNRIYGFKEGTLDSLVYNSDLSEDTRVEEPDLLTLQNLTMEFALDNYSPLLDLNRYHAGVLDKRFVERFVVTDGSVSSVNMTPNRYGTRRVTIADINSDFDYEGGSWSGTTCWFPPHIDIDFGIGSRIIVVGRTSQGKNDDGTPSDVTINVSGILVTENMGVVAEPFEADEEDLDWF